MADNKTSPNQIIVQKPDGREGEVEAIAAHVRAMLMRLGSKSCIPTQHEESQNLSG
jgi:hypothetical protein